jgi:hypothetical protein
MTPVSSVDGRFIVSVGKKASKRRPAGTVGNDELAFSDEEDVDYQQLSARSGTTLPPLRRPVSQNGMLAPQKLDKPQSRSVTPTKTTKPEGTSRTSTPGGKTEEEKKRREELKRKVEEEKKKQEEEKKRKAEERKRREEERLRAEEEKRIKAEVI